MIQDAVPPGFSGRLVGRRSANLLGAGASRRAVLPGHVAGALEELARAHHEAVGTIPAKSKGRAVTIYAPELIRANFATPADPAVTMPPPAELKTPSLRLDFEAFFARAEDPWGYTNDYERVKYEQTASLVPKLRIDRALELACAEGHFTRLLAAQVKTLLATDLSDIAVRRARRRCEGLSNVSFDQLDMVNDPLPGRFDLIVCSEVFYYLGDLATLQRVAGKIAEALSPGGFFLTAHANVLADEPDQPGRDWNVPFGAKTIEEVFSSHEQLRLVRQILTPLYRIQLFQRTGSAVPVTALATEYAEMGTLPPKVTNRVKWNGGRPIDDRPKVGTERLPILMYHRVASRESSDADRYCVTPEAFEEQLQFLKESGCYSTTLQAWRAAMWGRKPLPGKAVLLTFDDGYSDFAEVAWPALQRHGFGATVFIISGKAGGTSDWRTDAAPLMNWSQIRQLRDQGVQFGAHGHTHRSFLTMSPDEQVTELVQARQTLEHELQRPVTTFCYPYGETDRVLQHFTGACGYEMAVGVRFDVSRYSDSLLDLPRIEITGHDDFESFVAKLWAGTI